MTTRLRCHFVAVSAGIQPAALAGVKDVIESQFARGSHDEIEIRCSDLVQSGNPIPRTQAVSGLQLHGQLHQINANQAGQPTTDLYVLLASRYDKIANAFGLMFDRGYPTPDDRTTNPVFHAYPRQACALFLDTINAWRGEDRQRELCFTAVHELGHVFNLQHQDGPCFMRTSGDTVYAGDHWRFSVHDQLRLADCEHDPTVMPGGSIFAAGTATNAIVTRIDPQAPLRLDIATARTAFHRYDPTHIEVTVALRAPGPSIVIPEVIDPSRSAFRIYVENAAGERSLYRAPYRACGPAGHIEIGADKPFQRDLPIFAQAQGYTFTHVGPHQIWAELDLGEQRIVSNKLDVDILPDGRKTAAERKARAVLTDPGVASLLFHREAPDNAAARQLARFIDRAPAGDVAAELFYALGRSALRRAALCDDKRYVDRGLDFLRRALDREGLLPHQIARAEALLS